MNWLLDKSAWHCAVFAAVVWSCPLQATDGVVSSPNCNNAGFTSVFNTVDGSGGGTITFDCGASPVTITFTIYKSVSGNDVIDGGNLVSFDGNDSSAFFQVFNAKSLTLKRLTLQHGVFSSSHALENFGTLTLSDVTVMKNVSTDSAIYNSGSVSITSSTFTTNGIVSNGVNLLGAALHNDGGSVQIVGSSFTGNTIKNLANLSAGGGGAIGNSSGDLHVSSSTFTNNSALDGGAIDVSGGTATIGNSTSGSQFVGNTSQTTGGALSCSAGSVAINNSAFGGNQAGTTGGAIYSQCGLTVTNATFNTNTASGNGGGAIYQIGTQAGTVTYATIAGNTSIFGAGVYNDGGGSSTLTISKSIISANTGGNCDGVITSGGYNLANDMGCGSAFGVTDLSNATLPLGTITNNGGPTSTMLPLTGNQAINFIPNAQCAIDHDQRNAGRPSPLNPACDSGAVELNGIFDGIFADGFEF